MIWDISTECTACVIVCIIFLYARETNGIPNFKNKMFQICLICTFFAIVFNILSTFMIYYYQEIPLALTWSITSIYFFLTPLMGTVYFYYIIAIIYENMNDVKRIITISILPYLFYFIALIANAWNGIIFSIDPNLGYVRGEYIFSTYSLFYFYSALSVIFVLKNWNTIDISIRKILAYFPFIAFIVIIIQQVFSNYILSGSAAACALLIIYLYLQNKQITLDFLTGLSNRQEFSKMLELKIKEKRNPFIVITLSVNNFKFINDKFGQKNGDEFLKELSAIVKEVGQGNRLYRYGGDQFAILLEKFNPGEEKLMIKKLVSFLEAPMEIGNYKYIISVAIGVIKFPEVAKTIEDVINGIESAIAKAKKEKVTSVSYCTEEMLQKIKRKNEIIEILVESLKRNSFDVYYQPIWSIREEKFIYAEALLRLNDEKLGSVSPGEFIPIAEETGLLIDMTYQVLDKVCKFIRKILDEGGEIQAIAINFSFIQFMQEDLKEQVLSIIKKNEIPYSKIKIEITESALITNYEMVRHFIESMSVSKINFGLDDYGTGFSNISSVIEIPFETIKIDKSILWSAMDTQKASAFMRHSARAFKEMGMMVLVEGVETKEQSEFVIDCDCDCIQGFFYAMPTPGEIAQKSFIPS